MDDSVKALSWTTVILHWVVGFGMIILIVMGIYMENNNVFSLFPLHKSLGISLFVIIMIRVVWRIKEGWPENVNKTSSFENNLARIVHWILILGTLFMPISGIAMNIMGGYGLQVFGIELLSRNLHIDTGKVVVINGSFAWFFGMIHGLFGKILVGAIVLHILGAFKHHFWNKDGTLKRMLTRVP